MTQLIIQPSTAENTKRLVLFALENERRIIRFGISRTEGQLEKFEKKFKMDSESFYRKFNAGDMGDDFEYIKWAGEYETLRKLRQDYDDLAGIRLC
ncbi:MAG: hypothetical protein V2I97_06675 [Desulfococcaceae bacterium]|jgi:hypothetical protein|nr:hypothetical protein [Desulfococcaceae bacterium]